MCAAESERLSFTPITRKNTAVTVLKKTYGYGYIHYALYDDNGKEIDLHTVDALSWIDWKKGVTFDESYMWAVPVLYGKSCHKGRGAGIIGIKTDAFDSLDGGCGHSGWTHSEPAEQSSMCLIALFREIPKPVSRYRQIRLTTDLSPWATICLKTATATGFTPKVRRFSTKAI